MHLTFMIQPEMDATGMNKGRVQTANTLAGSLQMSAVKMPTLLLVAPVVVG